MINYNNFFEEFAQLDGDIKKIFYDFFSNENPLLMITETHWKPNTDIYETAKGIVIKMEIAGVNQKDIEVTYHDKKLNIKGRRPDYAIPERVSCKQVEINYGEFEKTISFEEYKDKYIDDENIKATYKNGMLIVFVPYLKNTKKIANSIKIKIEGDSINE